MGQITGLTPEQEIIVNELQSDDYLTAQFYFTGGTALKTAYLQHRESDDLDFFSEQPFDTQIISKKLHEWSLKHHFTTGVKNIEDMIFYYLEFPNHTKLKIDFVHHPYKRVEKSQVFGRLQVDSLLDIAINKVLTSVQRTEVKDFVDLYYLLQMFGIWDLIQGVRVKYNVEIEPYILGIDFTKVNEFPALPKMLKPLTLEQLRQFFRQQAKTLGSKAVE